MTTPEDGLREAIARIFDHDGHTELCAFIRYPGGPFQPPDPCTCGGEDLTAALRSTPAAPQACGMSDCGDNTVALPHPTFDAPAAPQPCKSGIDRRAPARVFR